MNDSGLPLKKKKKKYVYKRNKEEYESPHVYRKEKIKRKCLRCDKPFDALGRFNRLCYNCKLIEDY